MKNRNDFSRIAFAYDFLASIIYGKSIRQSQIQTLKEIESNSYILILGGGTGWILEELDKLNIPLRVRYIEKSEGMMKRAKLRNIRNLDVTFSQSIKEPGSIGFDRVMTFYFLDVFSAENLKAEIKKIWQLLKPGGYLHFADFEISRGTDRVWQAPLSKAMHFFFKLTANLESERLLNLNREILDCGFSCKSKRFYFRKFICSRVYWKA